MKLADVPEYIDRTKGRLVTKMTVYNWARHGVKGEKLRTIMGRSKPNMPYKDMKLTTPEWVDDFLNRIESRLANGASA